MREFMLVVGIGGGSVEGSRPVVHEIWDWIHRSRLVVGEDVFAVDLGRSTIDLLEDRRASWRCPASQMLVLNFTRRSESHSLANLLDNGLTLANLYPHVEQIVWVVWVS
jgi:hypothetical protein